MDKFFATRFNGADILKRRKSPCEICEGVFTVENQSYGKSAAARLEKNGYEKITDRKLICNCTDDSADSPENEEGNEDSD